MTSFNTDDRTVITINRAPLSGVVLTVSNKGSNYLTADEARTIAHALLEHAAASDAARRAPKGWDVVETASDAD